MCKVYVDSARYKIETLDTAYSNPTWTGKVKLTSYTDEKDTATSDTLTLTFTNEDATYVKQLVEKAMANKDSNKLGAVALFEMDEDEFKENLKYYSKDYLSEFQSICTAAMNVMAEQKISDESNALYSDMYLPYYNKSVDIEAELKTREAEIAMLKRSKKT